MNIRDLLRSFISIGRNIIFAPRMDILFYYPQHFNRSKKGTNPFYDSLLEVCDKYGITYHLLEEPDYGTDKPRNSRAIPGDFFYWMVIVLRHVVRLFSGNRDFYLNEKKVGFLMDLISFHRFRYRKVISISGSMNELFLAINPSGEVFEMQHGVVFGGKDSFFESDGSLHPAYQSPNFHWLFWGKGYKDSVIAGKEKDFEGRVHVCGYPLENLNCKMCASVESSKKILLFSLQFTADWNQQMLYDQKQLLLQTLDKLQQTEGIQVVLKHHPRFNQVIDLSEISERFDFVSYTDLRIQDLAPSVLLHVTFDSTTAFEYAQLGIPTYFMRNAKFPHSDNIFYKDYCYPLYQDDSIVDAINHLKKKGVISEGTQIVQKWYKQYYSPFNKEVVLSILK